MCSAGLWNPDHQIVGQLHGGTADCSGGWDQYGKMDESWSALEAFLDPCSAGAISIDGYDPGSGGVGCGSTVSIIIKILLKIIISSHL